MRYSQSLIPLLMLTLSACGNDFHDNEQGLVVTLSSEDTTDLTAANRLDIWVTDATGSISATRSYSSPKALASDVIALNAADYYVMVGMNITSAYNVTESPMLITLNEQNPVHAYYGVDRVSVSSVGLTYANVAVRRVLSQLTVTVTDLPSTATLDATVTNAATGVYPLSWDDVNSCYGVASEISAPVTLPSATNSGSVSSTCRLMPTVATEANSTLKLMVTLADGTARQTNILAPKMYPAGNYLFEVKYDELSSGLILSAVRINGWTEGWIINGEITDADN